MRRYESDKYREIRKRVLKRDRYRCQMPECKCRRNLQVHHILTYSNNVYLREEEYNLITLCYSCHKSIKGKESFFVNLFRRIVDDNNSR